MTDNNEVEVEEWTEDIEDGIEDAEPEAANSWGADSVGDSLSESINPLAAMMASGVYDLDKTPDNPNIVPEGSYECELKSVQFTEPSKWSGKNEGRTALRLTFVITDKSSGYMFKTVNKNLYLPLNGEKSEYAQELFDKLKQAHFSLGIKRSEFATANLQEYVGTPVRVRWNIMPRDDGSEMNTVGWFRAI